MLGVVSHASVRCNKVLYALSCDDNGPYSQSSFSTKTIEKYLREVSNGGYRDAESRTHSSHRLPDWTRKYTFGVLAHVKCKHDVYGCRQKLAQRM